MYAMKYMNKLASIEKHAIGNVIREVNLLLQLNHPYIVNLWYTFQDNEDLFMVFDLLMGGDLRFHMSNESVNFSEQSVKLYLCQICSVLEYLRSKSIIHRDIKPDNLLLDSKGHIHLTDFNVATQVNETGKSFSLCGTKPYMSYEFFCDNLEEDGYSYEVDWWSLGIVAFEMLMKKRPFKIQSNSSSPECKYLVDNSRFYSQYNCSEFISTDMFKLILSLLTRDPNSRSSTLKDIKSFSCMSDINWNTISNKNIEPHFKPSSQHLNCDPTFELEEMIIESKPLHKKEKRLAKQKLNKSGNRENEIHSDLKVILDNLDKEFPVFNRERWLNVENNQMFSNLT